MRRLASLIGITLLTLTLSGWGNVLAAAFCPHAGLGQSQAMGVGHAHCSAKMEMAETPMPASEHAMMDEMEMPATSSVAGRQAQVPAALGQFAGTCTHCIGQNESPATQGSVRALTLKRSEQSATLEQGAAPSTLHAVHFTTRFIPTQHAPPGPTHRQHLLFSVFLI